MTIGTRTILRRNYTLPSGKQIVSDIIANSDVVIVLAITKDQKVVVIRHFRTGPSKILYELPAGKVDPGEDPDLAAPRELLEETGYTGQLTKAGTTFAGPSSTQIQHIYVCRDAHQIQTQNLSPFEFIELELWELADFRKWLLTGETAVLAAAYLAMDYADLL